MPDHSQTAITVRAAEKTDAPALADLMTQLGYNTRVAEMEMRLEAIATDPHFRTFVAVKDGRVCGMIGTLAYFSHEHNDPNGRITALVVANEARRAGVGRRLIAVAENDFARRNITRIALNARFARTEAHEFYENLGYEKNGFRFVKNLAAAAD